MAKNSLKNSAYQDLLKKVVHIVKQSRLEAAHQLNREQMMLYYKIGEIIVEKQETEGWGKSIVEQLSKDLEKKLGITRLFY
jgi:hypothetical protein